jgi:CRP-like cAMP-binding protein
VADAASLAGLSPFEVIEQASFFSSLTTSQRRRVASVAKAVEFASRKDIYNLGDEAQCCYVLVRGVVRFNLALGNRTAAAGEIIRSGELFGWAAMIRTAQRRIATASCVTDCSVVAIEGNALLRLMDDDHSLGYAIMSRVSLLITSTITALVTG